MPYEILRSQALDEAQAWANTFPSTPNAATALLDWLNGTPPTQQGEETIIIMHPKH